MAIEGSLSSLCTDGGATLSGVVREMRDELLIERLGRARPR